MKERTERRGEELHRSQSQLSLLRCMRGEKRAACATEFGSRVARRDQNLKGLHSRSPRCNHVGHFGERSGTITTLYTESLTVHLFVRSDFVKSARTSFRVRVRDLVDVISHPLGGVILGRRLQTLKKVVTHLLALLRRPRLLMACQQNMSVKGICSTESPYSGIRFKSRTH